MRNIISVILCLLAILVSMGFVHLESKDKGINWLKPHPLRWHCSKCGSPNSEANTSCRYCGEPR